MVTILKKWQDLPENLKNEAVKEYYDILAIKKSSLVLKRIFDILVACILLVILLPFFLIIGLSIKFDSKGSILFRQTRVTQYGRHFRIFKFRTMVENAEIIGSQVTGKNDSRVTQVGKFLRKVRLDELPQLFNVISGDMTFVGARPEVVKYVDQYTNEMLATLLLPAGVTSEASILYKDEADLLANTENYDLTYVQQILPEKMKYNLQSIVEFSFINDIKTMFRTIGVVIKKN